MTVELVDMDTALSANPAYFQSTSPNVHPNDTGAELVAEAIVADLRAETHIIEIAFGGTWKTADTDLVWVDVTGQVLNETGLKSRRGRRSIQERFSTGELSLQLLNSDRLFDPDYTAGDYYGQLIPGVPIRWRDSVDLDVLPIFRGFVTGFPQRYDISNKFSYVPVQAYGIFDKLSRAKLPQSAVDVEVLADSPVAYWKLDDITEAEMLDSSGNDNHGIYDNPELEQDPLVDDGGKAVFFDHVGDHRGKVNQALASAYPFTLEAWVKFPRDLAAIHSFMLGQKDTSLGSWAWLACWDNVGPYAGYNPNGCLTMSLSGGRFVTGSTTIDDNATHHVVGIANSATSIALYVDGASESITTVESGSGTATPSQYVWWTVGNTLNLKSGDYGIAGILDNVAVYPSALSGARILEHYNAGTSPYDGDTTDERLDRILDVVGIPSDRRDLEACTTILGPTVLGQQRALDYLRLVEASEDGRMFETADGKIRFLDRYWGVTDSLATTSQYTFSDTGTVSYSTLDIDPDDELLVNVATVTREGGAALTVRNQTSIDTYGEADTSVDVLLQTDAEARSLGEHLVLVRGTPEDRVSRLRVPLHKYTTTQRAAILGLDIGYEITVSRTPQQVGSANTLTLIIEGVEHDANLVEHWIEFNVSVAPTDIVGLWGTDNWGTGRWGW